MTGDGGASDNPDDPRSGGKYRAGPRFVSPPAPPAEPPSEEAHRSEIPQPPPDVSHHESELFSSRYVPFDGAGARTQEPTRPVVPRAVHRGSSRRRQKLSGSRYVPIDGSAALSARPSKALLIASTTAGAVAVALAAVWRGSDAGGPVAGALVALALAGATLAVWWFGTPRMAALTLLGSAALVCGVVLVLAISDPSDDASGIGPSALEDDFDLLYGRCQDDSDIACDLLYRTSWEGSVRSSFALELTRDCGGRGLSGVGFCTVDLADRGLDGNADDGTVGWVAVTKACEQGDMLACDLVTTAAQADSVLLLVGETCGDRRPASSNTCRSQFGATVPG